MALPPSPLVGQFLLGARVVRDTFRFTGRATRTEVFSYMLFCVVVSVAGVIIYAVVDTLIDPGWNDMEIRSEAIIGIAMSAIPFIPTAALAARRAQDVGLPGWPFALIVPPVLALGIWRSLHFTPYHTELPPALLEWLRVLGALLFYGILLWAPKRGPNRYGPDPRLEDQPAVA